MLNPILCLSVMSVLIVGVISLGLSITAASSSLNIYPPGSSPYGVPYSEHIENFWKWILAIPAKDNPFDDQTGEKCATGQSNRSSMFYLSPNSGGRSDRTCEVPVGKALFIPLMPAEYSDLEQRGASVEQLSATVKKDQDAVNSLYLKIDDKEYKYDNLTKYRIHPTPPFEVTYPDNAIFGVVKGGNSTAVADGYYIITEPLAKGNHTIHYKSSLICSDPDCAEPNFVIDIKYNIIAK